MKQYLGEEEEGPDGKVYYKLCTYAISGWLSALIYAH
jgi:hypothetical protein